MQWSEMHGCFKATCGILDIEIAWQSGAYIVRVNKLRLRPTYADSDAAKVAAIDYARRLLREALAAIGEE
jgi:hypothetical protein